MGLAYQISGNSIKPHIQEYDISIKIDKNVWKHLDNLELNTSIFEKLIYGKCGHSFSGKSMD